LYELRSIKESYERMIKEVDQGILDELRRVTEERDVARYSLEDIKSQTNEKLTEANEKIRAMRRLIKSLRTDLKR